MRLLPLFQRGTEIPKPQALIQMWKPYREFLIQQHRFYVNEASTRLMSQFDKINADADKTAEAWLERRGELFDPDRDDEGAIYEEAESVAIDFYRQLDEMREQTRLDFWMLDMGCDYPVEVFGMSTPEYLQRKDAKFEIYANLEKYPKGWWFWDVLKQEEIPPLPTLEFDTPISFADRS